jgi:uncharacterized protein (DUF2141 family)
MRILPGLLLILPTLALGAETSDLLIKVQNVKADKGKVVVNLYKDSDTWLKKDQALESKKVPAADKEVAVHFQVKPGTYAVQIFQDENGNGKLDMKWFPPGPAEPTVVSNNAKGMMGPPSFKDAKVKIQGDQTLTLSLK